MGALQSQIKPVDCDFAPEVILTLREGLAPPLSYV